MELPHITSLLTEAEAEPLGEAWGGGWEVGALRAHGEAEYTSQLGIFMASQKQQRQLKEAAMRRHQHPRSAAGVNVGWRHLAIMTSAAWHLPIIRTLAAETARALQ